jgi:hypothetical protein
VPSRASRKTGARAAACGDVDDSRAADFQESKLRVVTATSCDLRTWGWRASGSVLRWTLWT